MMVLENNRDTLTGAYEVAMSDTAYLKLKGKYSPKFNLEGGTSYQKYPNAVTPIYGIEQKSWDVSSSLSKIFSSGTTIAAGIGHPHTEIDWPPRSKFYSPEVFVSLQQELFKNSFVFALDSAAVVGVHQALKLLSSSAVLNARSSSARVSFANG